MCVLPRIFSTILLLTAGVFSQSTAPEQPIRTQKDLDTFLSKPLSDRDLLNARTYELKECTAENARLTHELDVNHQRQAITLAAFCGVGLGLAAAAFGFKRIRHVWSLSTAGKQLVVMLAAATWVTAVVFLEADNKSLSGHPVSVALSVVVYSIPAVLFAGIGAWWLRRNPAETVLESQH